MVKGIGKEIHGLTDYSYIPLTFAAPALVGYEKDKCAADATRAFAGLVLGYSLLTDAKWGAVKLTPYRTHAVLDFATGVLALATPWLGKFSGNKKARNTLLLMGLTGLVVGALSFIGSSRK